ncbi:Response regulator rcp1 [Gemmata obscuriglobus]|uniref:Response regulator n=1 Tax=Gemmata obscuriglobus TaxID=114 RepID=A0A2Z3GUA7_9BACT|nr:response regulator [Gemmata obscuriglobus]AWM37999.1 response regulator [Gemmata obscuriglobus]QEG29137.1 Response regulator rcp1 [Gemmata obscuriglobus]VTS07849.1 chemotaxis protein : Response regulator receiver protein OS=Gloeocapsa sp. PCC 7428 GN=Glo7428_2204 PE=4 SV=1: Response_reg [Gemmata obscuriglobus UQM 2246]
MSTHRPLDVLLVEDDPSDLKLTLHAFRKYHLANTLHVARDGAEALEFVFGTGRYADRTGGHPHLILLDLKLPLVDGIEVLRRLKESPVSRSIPIVVLTSSREDRDLTACYELGVNSYIVKPVDFDQFGEVVRQLGFYWLLINQPPPE